MVKRLLEVPELGSDDEYLVGEINAINRSRLNWVVPIFVVVHVAHFVAFWPYIPGATESRDLWRNGVILMHAAILTLVLTTFLIKRQIERRPWSGTIVTLMHELLGAYYLFGGAALALVDQRVTSSITPFFISAIGVALVIVTRPAMALGLYALDMAFFTVGLAWTQTNPDILLTNRINSVTAVSLGFGLALLQWRNQRVTLAQKRRIAEQQRELEEKNRELTQLATRDTLTGLLNRGHFLHQAQLEIIRLHALGSTACLVMMDIDQFKTVNDTYGHPAGDAILAETAGILGESLSGRGLLARFGGEEFAFFLPATSLEEAVSLTERIRTAVAEHSFAVVGGSIQVTASFGMAEISGSNGVLDWCYREADAALYQAKHDGRNCVRVAPQDGEPLERAGTTAKRAGSIS